MQMTSQQRQIVECARNNYDLIAKARAGTGKGLREDQPVVTPKGMVPIGLLKEGDLVCGTDGHSYPVVGIYDRGVLPLYEVKFNDGQSVITDGDHRWLCQTKYERDHHLEWKIRTTMDLLCIERKVFLPMPLPVDGTSDELPIDPWLLGALLGDGCLADNKKVGFTNPEIKMIDSVRSSLPNSCNLSLNAKIDWRITGNGYTGGQWRNNELLNSLRCLKLQGCASHQKFVPEVYMTSNKDVRLSVLQGLLDTDGHTSKNSLEFSTSSNQLALDARRLVESLGGLCSLAERGSHYIKDGVRIECKTSYRLHIRLPSGIHPFRNSLHKVEAFIPKTKYPPARQIVSITPIEEGRSICIEVGSRDHLFLTVGHAVTHNTSTIECVTRDQMHKNMLLLCFNKSIEVAAKERMPANTTCKTFHALAYPSHGKYFSHRLNLRFMPKPIAKRIGCDESIINVVKHTVRRFTASDDQFIGNFHVPRESVITKPEKEQNAFKEEVVQGARKLWLLKSNFKEREIPVDFDDYLKMFQIDGARVKGRFDAVIVDEAQDVTPRDLSIVHQIQGQKLLVGDDFQQLYSWRGSVNSLDELDFENCLYLTQSFRFGEAIAEKANEVLSLLNHNTPPLVGLSSKKSVIRWDNQPTERHTVLCRTNTGLLSEALYAVRNGRSIHIIGNMMESINLLESAWYLSIGQTQQVRHPTMTLIGDWNAVKELSEEDTDLKMLIKQVDKYNSSIPGICDELRSAGEMPSHKADILLSTVHKAKGMQWPVVKLAEDFPEEFLYFSKKERRYVVKKAEVFCLYVALTRAEDTLYANSTLSRIKHWKELID